jgi:hypothetical protein
VTRWKRVATCLAAVLTLGGCARSPLFIANHSVQILAPAPLALVSAPLRVAWRVHDLPVGVTQFLLFVDGSPLEPGQNLRALAQGDQSCLETSGCPNASYLAAHDIFLTGRKDVTIPYVAVLSGLEGADSMAIHRATLVLLDRHGDRVGEYAYTVQFRMRQSDASG